MIVTAAQRRIARNYWINPELLQNLPQENRELFAQIIEQEFGEKPEVEEAPKPAPKPVPKPEPVVEESVTSTQEEVEEEDKEDEEPSDEESE